MTEASQPASAAAPASPEPQGGTALPRGSTRRPILERFGLRYFERRSSKVPLPEAVDEVHFLNPDERRALRAISRGTVSRATFAGALSGLASALAEIWATGSLAVSVSAETGLLADWEQNAAFWGVVLGITGVATALEISFLYWDSLRSVHALSRAAGMPLFEDDGTERNAVVALVRAAMELPNPADAMLGVDPRREISRWRVVLAALIYKAKVGVTNFAVKMFVRRFLGRIALRTWLPLMAVPVTAAWNAIVSYRVLRESRLRVMGPSAAGELAEVLVGSGDQPALTVDEGVAALRAVAASVVRTRDMHPNLAELIVEVACRVPPPPDEAPLDDWSLYLEQLPTLDAAVRRRVLLLHVTSIIIDGRVNPRELSLLRTACAQSDHHMDVDALREYHRRFVRGDAFDRDLLFAIVHEGPARSEPAE